MVLDIPIAVDLLEGDLVLRAGPDEAVVGFLVGGDVAAGSDESSDVPCWEDLE